MHVMCLIGRLKYRKSFKLERFIESHKNKKRSQLSRNGAAEQKKVSKELNENSKETDIKVFMVIIYSQPPHTPAVSNKMSKRKSCTFQKTHKKLLQ